MKTLGVLAALVAVLCTAVPAAATTVLADPQTFRNQQTGRCLDDSFEFGTRPFLCNGLNYQKWWVRVDSDGSREFRNVHTGRCIGGNFNNTVTPGECGTSSEARWMIRRWGDGTLELKNLAHSTCLGDYELLRVYRCDASQRQSWF